MTIMLLVILPLFGRIVSTSPDKVAWLAALEEIRIRRRKVFFFSQFDRRRRAFCKLDVKSQLNDGTQFDLFAQCDIVSWCELFNLRD